MIPLLLMNCLIPFILALIAAYWPLDVRIIGGVATIHEVFSAVIVFKLLAGMQGQVISRYWDKMFRIAMFCVATGDFSYGLITYILKVPSPRNYLPLVHEVPYVLFASFLCIVSLVRALHNISPNEKRILSLSIFGISLIFFVCSYFMVLGPFYHDKLHRPLIMYVTSTLYAVSQSISVGGLFISCLRALEFSEFYIWLMFLVLIGSDFALRYQDLGNVISRLPIFEYGWEFGLSGIALGMYGMKTIVRNTQNMLIAPLNSMRFISAGLSFGILLLFVVVSWILTSYLQITTGADVGEFVIALVAIFALANVLSIYASRFITKQVEFLTLNVLADASGTKYQVGSRVLLEFSPSLGVLEELKIKFADTLSANIQLQTDAKLGKFASQVAHDIRSPLAALDVASRAFIELPEENRFLIQAATTRIKDISNSLLRYRENEPVETKLCQSGGELLFSLIEQVVSEKRIQLKVENRIFLEFLHVADSYKLFAQVNPQHFRRMLSNLIDNSIEAIKKNGLITISLSVKDKNSFIQICDNGKGIAKDSLGSILSSGGSIGKNGGLGLGLSHARRKIEEWKGSFSMDSKIGVGTMVDLLLPLAQHPLWYCESLIIPSGSDVVILDDDDSIHKIWKMRIDPLKCKLVHFFSPVEFINWIALNENQKEKIVLLDFEFNSSPTNGLDLVEKFNLIESAVLVTSHFEESSLRTRAELLGIKVLPKPFAGLIHVKII